MTSLAELKSIEQQRLADERAAVIRADELRLQAMLDAEREAREAREEAERAAYDRQLALERARVDAEREARLRVEAAEAAERARQQAVLEQERAQQEMELRRAEVAKKRPTWMLVVTALALVAACVLVVFTVEALGASDQANQARIEAENRAKAKDEETARMRAELDKLEASLEVLDGQVSSAMDRVIAAQGKAATDAAAAELRRLRQERADQARRAEELRRKRLLQLRLQGVQTVCGQAVCKDTK